MHAKEEQSQVLSMQNAAVRNAVSANISKAIFEIDNLTEGDEKVEYKPLYYFLFNGITEVLKMLEQDRCTDALCAEAVSILKKLHCDVEEMFMHQTE